MFQGWYENAELTGEPVSQTTHDTAHGRVFYAKWEPETLTVPNLDDLSFVYDGQSRSLRVTLSNSGILSYQWYKNDSAIEGATDSHYEVKDVADSGSYSVFVTRKGSVLEQGSSAATVNISRRPVVIRPQDQTIIFGDDLPTLTVDYLSVTQDGQEQSNTGLADGKPAARSSPRAGFPASI